MHEDYIIYDPFLGLNAYIENMKKCWGKLYKVISPAMAEDNILVLLNTKAVVLNWIEYNLDNEKIKQVLLNLAETRENSKNSGVMQPLEFLRIWRK